MPSKTIHSTSVSAGRVRLSAALSVAALLAACGGAADNAPLSATPAPPAAAASAVTTLQMTTEGQSEASAAAAIVARPMFNLAPALLDEPDLAGAEAEAGRAPRTHRLSAGEQAVSTRRLTVQAIRERRQSHAAAAADAAAADATSGLSPMASGAVVATYSPAQIRAAYGLPALPAAGASLSAAQRAQLGAGQTIYIVDAMHDPNVAAELAAFNSKFGLPACSVKPIAVNQALPLAAASATACELSVVYNTAAGAMTAAAPPYDAGWATEIALDVQWAHAIAPLARIVLIEAADASLNSLIGAIKLANAMGPGAVSMSFGAGEGSWTGSVDGAFGGANMSYLAATGDNGAAVSWPAVSPKVLAVGGTSLSWSGSGVRSETSWSGTGGGTSAYTATPSYQNSTVPGVGQLLRRTVADVAFNADPSTGQYVAVMAPGSALSWVSAGGTSLSTPQWAGLVAVANALRAQAARPALGAPHAVLYGQIGAVPVNYASAFADVVKGANGSCATCLARAGYDPLAGLGTPNAASLLQVLSGAVVGAAPPQVSAAAISGKAGTPLTFTIAASAANPLTFSLSGAPAGMTVDSAGVVRWPTPLLGSYSVTAVARDSKTGLSGQGVYSVTVTAPPAPAAPVVNTASIAGRPGVALSYAVGVVAPNAVTYSLSGAPAGMSIGASGLLSWPSPVLGSYKITVTARDSKTGLSGQGVLTIQIASAGPVFTVTPQSGVAGKPFSGSIGLTAPGATSLSVSIAGAPLGMGFAYNGSAITMAWAKPVTGSYTLSLVAVDSAGLSAKASVPIVINAK